MFTKVYKLPYGVSLIISPFNFPILLSFGVLAASIAGGNTALIKASSKSSECTRVMKEMISKIYKEEYVTVIDGGHDVADYCLEEKVDTIIACSTNASNGPFIYHYDESQGAFPTEPWDKYAESGITLKFSSGILDTQVYGLKECGSDNRNIEMDYSESSNWIDFYTTRDRKSVV